jgi:hypothetical protein
MVTEMLKNSLGIPAPAPSVLGSSHSQLAINDRAHSSYDIRGREHTPYKVFQCI